jgi:hypothetical protein
MAARIAKSFASPTNQVFRLCGRNSGGLPDGKTTAKKAAASQRTGVTSNSRLGRSLSSPSASLKSLLGTRRRATSVFFRYSSCSLLPLHSAIASAKMVPQLNSTADTLLQGTTTTTTKPFFFFFLLLLSWGFRKTRNAAIFFTKLLIPVTNFANYKCRASNNPGSNLHGSTNQKSISQGNKLCKSFAPFYKFKED